MNATTEYLISKPTIYANIIFYDFGFFVGLK